MVKTKFTHRPSLAGGLPEKHNFFYRLVSSQRFLAIVGLVFLLIILIPLARTYSQRRLIEQEIADVKKEISDFENKNQELKSMIAYLESDQSFEEQARLNLNLKKPGEQVVVVEEKLPLAASSSGSDLAEENNSNLLKWWQYFFN